MSFPSSHVELGKYALTIGAVGYDLNGPRFMEVAEGKITNAKLKLELARSKFSKTPSIN